MCCPASSRSDRCRTSTALPPRALGGELRGLQNSLNSVLSYSFFITKKMKTQLRDGRLTGTLPILYTFLARPGKR